MQIRTRPIDTLTDSLTNRKALYAVIGANRLAYEKLRELPTELGRLQGKVQDTLQELPTHLSQLTGPRDVREVSTQVRELPAQARRYAEELSGRAGDLYTEFAARGEQLVTRIRRQDSTVAVRRAARATARNAAATRASARRAAKAVEVAAKDATEQLD